MECRVLSRHKMIRHANLAAQAGDRGYFYATTGRSRFSSPGILPALQEPRSFTIWLSPTEHELTILDDEADVVSGEIRFAGGLADPLNDRLPGLLHVSMQSAPALGFLFDQLLAETASSRPGWERICDHLADMLVVQALRSEIVNRPGAGCGRLRGLADPEIGPALQLMHEQPEVPWTVGSLAKRLAVSRSNFAARFKTVVGETPLGYLTRLRLLKAAALLRDDSGLSLPVVALNVGYQTETAFGKSFKRQFGISPGAYRRSLNGSPHRQASALQRELKKRNAFESLEQEVGINLVRTFDDFHRVSDALWRQFGLLQSEYNILRILRGSGETLSADEIVSRMVARPKSIRAILAKLKRNGLIEEAPRGLYRVASAGRERLGAMDEPVLEMHRQHLAHLSTPEKEELTRLLVKVRQRS